MCHFLAMNVDKNRVPSVSFYPIAKVDRKQKKKYQKYIYIRLLNVLNVFLSLFTNYRLGIVIKMRWFNYHRMNMTGLKHKCDIKICSLICRRVNVNAMHKITNPYFLLIFFFFLIFPFVKCLMWKIHMLYTVN